MPRPTAFDALTVTPHAARYRPVDLVFRARVADPNPFSVRFAAHVDGPSCLDFTLPGFHDGDDRWVIRLAGTEPGSWQVELTSDEPALAGLRTTLEVEPATDLAGGILVDPEYPRSFIYESGLPRYPVGYACEWLWGLDLGRADGDLPTLLPFLDRLVAAGFNEILLASYAHDTAWRPGRSGPDDFGPPACWPWAGSPESPDFSRFNLAYWQHFDRVMQATSDRGLAVCLMLKVFDKQVNWPPAGSADEERFLCWLAARYAAFSNLIWSVAKEGQHEPDLAAKQAVCRRLRELDPYRRLLTTHDDDEAYECGAYDQLLDYRADQCHRDLHATVLRQRAKREWPVANVEFGYECGPGGLSDCTYPVAQLPEELSLRAWEVVMAGGYVAYSYTYTAWDVIRSTDTPRGHEDFGIIRNVFESTGFWALVPCDDLIDRGYCLANKGIEYLALSPLGQDFQLDFVGEYTGEWIRCLTGERQPVGPVRGPKRLWPPWEWRGAPVLLHLGGRPDRPAVYRSTLRRELPG